MTQYRPFQEKRPYALITAIVLLAICLSYSSYRDLFGVRAVLLAGLYPFQFTARTVWSGATGLPARIVRLGKLERENAELREKLNTALSRQAVLDELRQENERLRAALAFQERNPYGFRLLAARVVAKSGSPWSALIEIDRGSRAGARVDLPVMVKSGLVGRVIEVSPFSAKVQLITDPQSSVAALDQRSRDFGVIEGAAPQTLRLKYVATGGEVRAGDPIVSDTVSGVFPAGLPIGQVTSVNKKDADLFYEIQVRPAADLSKLEEVFLII